jgi:hypothetical protein
MRLCLLESLLAIMPSRPEKPRDLALKGLTYQIALYGGEALTEPTHKRHIPFPAQLSGVIRPTSVRWLCTAPAVSLIVHHNLRPCSPSLTRRAAVTSSILQCEQFPALWYSLLRNHSREQITRFALRNYLHLEQSLEANKKRQHVEGFKHKCSFIKAP